MFRGTMKVKATERGGSAAGKGELPALIVCANSGGYHIVSVAGPRPLQKSPSGHLVMVIDDYEKVIKKGGVQEVPLQLHTNEAAAAPPPAKL